MLKGNDLASKKYFLFDIDGTLAIDDTIYDGSRELLDYIDNIGGKAFYITNNSVKSRKDYIKKFRKWNIFTEEDQFVTASYATCKYLKEHYADKKLLVVGTPSFEEELRSFGLTVTHEAEKDVACVVVGFDRTLVYEKVEEACKALFCSEVDFVGTNPDYRCPTAFGFVPDCGGICEMLRVTTDRTPYYAGKPNAQIVKMCMEQAGARPEEVLVVGDRLYTDIACGINAGVETALVYTGEAKPEDLETTEFMPDYAFENIRELYERFRVSRKRQKQENIYDDNRDHNRNTGGGSTSGISGNVPGASHILCDALPGDIAKDCRKADVGIFK